MGSAEDGDAGIVDHPAAEIALGGQQGKMLRIFGPFAEQPEQGTLGPMPNLRSAFGYDRHESVKVVPSDRPGTGTLR